MTHHQTDAAIDDLLAYSADEIPERVTQYDNYAEAVRAIKRLVLQSQIAVWKNITPPEQYTDYAKLAGRENCVICGFNSEEFRRHIELEITALQKEIEEI